MLFIGYSLSVIIENKYLMGVPLGEVAEEVKNCYNFGKRIQHENSFICATIYQRVVSALRGLAGDPFAFGAEGYNENSFMELIKDDNVSLLTYYFTEIQLCYLLGDYGNALALAEKAHNNIGAIMGFRFSTDYNFFYSLAITAVYDGLPTEKKRKYRRILKNNQLQMKKWSDFCKGNYLHKYLLVAAEISRLSGRGQEAMALYDQSIQSAGENGYVQNEALANELAAKYYMSEGRKKIARTYMSDAWRGYCGWGARAKARALRCRYPDLLDEMDVEEENYSAEIFKNIFRISATSDSEETGSMDTYTIHKAVQNISEETDPCKLLKGFLELAIESTGADKGYLILEKNDKLFIEAAKDSDKCQVAVVKPVSMEKSANLSRAVVRYVARTLETVVLNGGGQTGIFAKDNYLAQSAAISIACLPVSFHGITVGVLYLENSLMTGVFTPARLEVLKLLSTQMAYVKALQAYLEEGPAEMNGGAHMPLTEPLTEREVEVLKLIAAAGMSNKEIAESLELTINTVKTHVKNIYGKLQVNRRVQVAARAKELKLLKD
jgi:DNA-binding CsgD family transcriptional regulator/GAF domain-containing protein